MNTTDALNILEQNGLNTAVEKRLTVLIEKKGSEYFITCNKWHYYSQKLLTLQKTQK